MMPTELQKKKIVEKIILLSVYNYYKNNLSNNCR